MFSSGVLTVLLICLGIKGPVGSRRTYLKELHSENISLLITKDVWRKGKRK